MKSCTSRQHQLDHLAIGDPDFAMSRNVFRDLSRHIENCPSCSGHALTLLAFESMRGTPLDGPNQTKEEELLAALPQRKSSAVPTWIRVASFLLATWGAFLVGRAQTASEKLAQPNNGETTEIEEKSVPTISLNRHVDQGGFLASRTLIVDVNN